MPSKKPTTRAAKPVQPAKADQPAAARPVRLTGAIGRKGTLAVAGLVMAGGILVAARQQTQPALATTPHLESVPMPSVPARSMTDANTRTAAPLSSTSPVESAAKVAPTVTISGCLERDGDGFRLKDVSGAEAPKARSWKSGFLKKGAASVDVVDASHSLRLADQVGKRVSVTGPLADKEMSARSLHRLAASCSK
jgi:hypothetical protein